MNTELLFYSRMLGEWKVEEGRDLVTWNNIEEYCEAKEEWLSKFLDLQNGIPSHDTFNRVISSIDSHHFEHCFIEWVSELI